MKSKGRGPQKKAAAKVESHTPNGEIRNVCVYCGSGLGVNPKFGEAARTLGRTLAEERIGLVYGGGSLGLMGEVARATLAGGGHVTGIIPDFLSTKEHMLEEAQEIIVTSSMHERKQYMFMKSDAFVALPGGAGTLDELFEQITWAQLERHSKPIVVANIDGYWDPLLSLLDHMRGEMFIRPGIEVNLKVAKEAGDILPLVRQAAAEMAKGPAAEAFPSKL
jgi:uncharacterized protein (TIGR00730 family)